MSRILDFGFAIFVAQRSEYFRLQSHPKSKIQNLKSKID
ncbi:hypothetical protein NSP_45440 [Nodularia spumigena CCY9414]|nr:hypothetical protein NSP_45440 [Nodularia spumigena CCY9414]